MSMFDFSKCVVDDKEVICVGKDGKLYRMSLPQEIPIEECDPCKIAMLFKELVKDQRS